MEELIKIQKILSSFIPFEPKENDNYKFVNILTGNFRPPSYIVQILLLGILGLENHGTMEKVYWHSFFLYKDYPFMIRDYKFGSWTIEGIEESEHIVQLAKEIRCKIIKASQKLDKYLYEHLKTEIVRRNYFLNNVYSKLFSVYEFYEERVLETIAKSSMNRKKLRTALNVAEILNFNLEIQRTISNYCFALVLSFFSLLEFLIDVIFIFENTGEQFFEFKKKRLNDRIKIAFPIKKFKELTYIYEKLLDLRKNYRNPLAHGLSSEANLLVPVPKIGLIPLSYEYLFNSIYYRFYEIGIDQAQEMIKLFRKFINYIDSKEPYRFYLLFLNYGFPIPTNSEEIKKIKTMMTSYEKFKEYLEFRSSFECMVINRDILL